MSYSNCELYLFLQLINDYEPGIIKIIKYYTRNLDNAKLRKPRTGCSFFVREQIKNIPIKHPKKTFGEIAKLTVKYWQELTDEERNIYRNKQTQDKIRYYKDICNYLTR